MKLENWLKENGFDSWEQAKKNGDIHIESNERDMKLWFLEDFSLGEVLDILENRKSTNYGCWDYIDELDIWVFIYN